MPCNIRKIVCPLPPRSWFGGRDSAGTEVLAQALRRMGYQVFMMDIEEFLSGEQLHVDRVIDAVCNFGPDLAAAPNAGYGLACRRDEPEAGGNLFADIMGIPLVLPWDDPLGQFSRVLLEPLPDRPAESQGGCLQKIRAGIDNPLMLHLAWDSGHVRAVERLGLLTPGTVSTRLLYTPDVHRDLGLAQGPSRRWRRDLCFTGNVYLNQITEDPLAAIPEIRGLAEEVAAEKWHDLTHSVWDILLEKTEQMPGELFSSLKLSPEESFFWRAYVYITWSSANTLVRMKMLSSLGRPVDFFGGFADPDGMSQLDGDSHLRFRGSVDYLTELPEVYRSSRITVEVTNCLAQQSAPCKFFECFAAGGFMLVDRKPDLVAAFGEPFERISYRNADELREKAAYFLDHEAERLELVRHFQELICERYSIEQWLEHVIGTCRERLDKDLEQRDPVPAEPAPCHWEPRYLAHAMWNQRPALETAAPKLNEMHGHLRRFMPPGHPPDLPRTQWFQLFALALEFKPDLILELGRGYGNSTLAFTAAAHTLSLGARGLVSVCRQPWEPVRAWIDPFVGDDWFAPLQAVEGEILGHDFAATLGEASRVLLFWDAHGYQVAEFVLGCILPLLADRQHLVLVHDIDDARYFAAGTGYRGYGTWKGEAEWPGPTLRLGRLLGSVPQLVSLVDFCSRNHIEVSTAAAGMRSFFIERIDRLREMQALLGTNPLACQGGMSWFSLNQADGPYHFPRWFAPETAEPEAPVPPAPEAPRAESLSTRIKGLFSGKAIKGGS